MSYSTASQFDSSPSQREEKKFGAENTGKIKKCSSVVLYHWSMGLSVLPFHLVTRSLCLLPLFSVSFFPFSFFFPSCALLHPHFLFSLLLLLWSCHPLLSSSTSLFHPLTCLSYTYPLILLFPSLPFLPLLILFSSPLSSYFLPNPLVIPLHLSHPHFFLLVFLLFLACIVNMSLLSISVCLEFLKIHANSFVRSSSIFGL